MSGRSGGERVLRRSGCGQYRRLSGAWLVALGGRSYSPGSRLPGKIFAMRWNTAVDWFDWIARLHFVGTLLSGVFGMIAGVAAYLEGWDWLLIVLAMIVAFAGVGIIYIAFCRFWDRRMARLKAAAPQSTKGDQEAKDDLSADIDASEAFHKVLTDSAWRDEQIRLTPDNSNLVRNWLEVRLDKEIHKALVNSHLKAWGEEILPNGADAPERPVPADRWVTIEIIFRPPGRRTLANTKVNPPYTGKLAWAGVKFNSAQFFSLFPLSSSIDRIPCTALLRLAENEGWDFSSANSLHLLDMQEAMRQGGLDNTLTFWGREKKFSSDQLMHIEPLQKIEADHWKNHYVHLFAAREGDNFNTYSWLQAAEIGRRGYIDLHVLRS